MYLSGFQRSGRAIVWIVVAMGLLVTVGRSVHVLAQSNLPAEVQADILRNEIVSSVKAAEKSRDYTAVLAEITEYDKLAVPMPAPVRLVEAKAAHSAGDALRALRALDKILTSSPRGSHEYQQAVQLYPEYKSDAAPALALEEEKQKKAEKEAAERKQKCGPIKQRVEETKAAWNRAFQESREAVDRHDWAALDRIKQAMNARSTLTQNANTKHCVHSDNPVFSSLI
jgi:hypothetical protein